MGKPTDLVQGTVDLLILKTIALEPMHGWAIAQRIRQLTDEILQVPAGVALPGAAAPRETGVDHRRVGCVRKQPAGALLSTDQGGSEAAD